MTVFINNDESTVFNGKTIFNTKDTKVTKEIYLSNVASFPLCVYFVPFVVRLFPAKYGRAVMMKRLALLMAQASSHKW